MRTVRLGVLFFFAFAVGSGGGNSSPQREATTGSGLLGSCKISVKTMDDRNYNESNFEAWRDGYCNGLVNGVTNASPQVCPDEAVTTGQTLRVVVKYLEDHPEELHLDNAVLAEKALAKAFPCPKG